jgi:hypothetical protein
MDRDQKKNKPTCLGINPFSYMPEAKPTGNDWIEWY